MLELSAVFILISLACFYYREPILSFLTSPLQGKQRLADGAFIAALMDQMGGNAETVATDVEAAGGGSGRKRGLIAESAERIRRVNMSELSLSLLAASPRDASYDASSSYALGEACGLGGVDFFVSHSWSDCPKQK